MRHLIVFAAAAVALALAVASGAQAPPCNDTSGDGSPSGLEYAQFHVSALAQEGMLGNGGHKPGSHHGFSLCNPSGR
ncbi:MAG TPA: hypothetical protein VFT80_09280 [Actinomycetota bacterium]|nr:hypothetical protein [Actinomycetota bacterium]